MMLARYCIDTSSLMRVDERYPRDIFRSLWDCLESAVESGVFVAPDEVLRELKKKSEHLCDWAKGKESLFIDIGEYAIQEAAREILSRFPRLVDTVKGRSTCDPFIVAVARTWGIAVVTEEQRSQDSRIPRIPDVCDHYGIPCFNLLAMMRQEKWNL